MTQLTSETIIHQTQNWIKSVVIDLNFCPFAAKALLQKTINYAVVTNENVNLVLECLHTEFAKLDTNPLIETSFIITPLIFNNFDDYLDLVNDANDLLQKLNYEGIYQVASFHPNYCFEDSNDDDAANYTNRSPYPMLHILREDSITKALSTYPHAHLIPENNINLSRQKGLQYMQTLKAACF